LYNDVWLAAQYLSAAATAKSKTESKAVRLLFEQEFAENSQLVKNGLSHLHAKLTAIETAVRANSVASAVERAVDETTRPAATESVRSKYNGRVLVRPAGGVAD